MCTHQHIVATHIHQFLIGDHIHNEVYRLTEYRVEPMHLMECDTPLLQVPQEGRQVGLCERVNMIGFAIFDVEDAFADQNHQFTVGLQCSPLDDEISVVFEHNLIVNGDFR